MRVDIDPTARVYPVLGFFIHPLAKTAIKYGMKTSSLPLQVRIADAPSHDWLSVMVSNTGHWISTGAEGDDDSLSTRTGLNNVRQRLENAFPVRHAFRTSVKDGWVHIQLKIRSDDGDANEIAVERFDRR